eukprot:12694963-Ditylum_brightwellii.AAC.1
MPTSVPSTIPTSIPSSLPTISPSNLPTSIPSTTPTLIPSGSPTKLCFSDQNGLFGDTGDSLATEVTYRYEVETDSNIDVDITKVIPKIEWAINDALLSLLFKACHNSNQNLRIERSPRVGRRLEIAALSSRPPDRSQNEDCLVNSDTQYDCTPVDGAVTIYIDGVQSDEKTT